MEHELDNMCLKNRDKFDTYSQSQLLPRKNTILPVLKKNEIVHFTIKPLSSNLINSFIIEKCIKFANHTIITQLPLQENFSRLLFRKLRSFQVLYLFKLRYNKNVNAQITFKMTRNIKSAYRRLCFFFIFEVVTILVVGYGERRCLVGFIARMLHYEILRIRPL